MTRNDISERIHAKGEKRQDPDLFKKINKKERTSIVFFQNFLWREVWVYIYSMYMGNIVPIDIIRGLWGCVSEEAAI